jgi:prepilin-type N-terminal cleavage/methylation domain-containing protein
MRKKRAFTFIEVIVAMLLVAIGMGVFVAVNIGYKYHITKLQYHYTALNLAREIQEYFEAIRLERNWSMSYYYATSGTCYSGHDTNGNGTTSCVNAAGCSWLRAPCNSSPGAYPISTNYSGYCLREAEIPPKILTTVTHCYPSERRVSTDLRPNETPFDILGDIGAKGLVPHGAPNSVRIDCNATYNSAYSAYVVTTNITWQEISPEGAAITCNETLSSIPLTPINNQLMLEVGELRWD